MSTLKQYDFCKNMFTDTGQNITNMSYSEDLLNRDCTTVLCKFIVCQGSELTKSQFRLYSTKLGRKVVSPEAQQQKQSNDFPESEYG